ncbi:unnamed protein product [Spirodela intermedia]|uniref:Uncharacterized protein n=1 Tax=Spirodela intermedia TaxID=51605 RepID=A0A7I8KS61_SPIIN|nr:unnamed protein product [Spirodela intermedia]
MRIVTNVCDPIRDHLVASRKKHEGNQDMINGILVPKNIVEKRLLGAHQDHHRLNITQPRTSAQQGFLSFITEIHQRRLSKGISLT